MWRRCPGGAARSHGVGQSRITVLTYLRTYVVLVAGDWCIRGSMESTGLLYHYHGGSTQITRKCTYYVHTNARTYLRTYDVRTHLRTHPRDIAPTPEGMPYVLICFCCFLTASSHQAITLQMAGRTHAEGSPVWCRPAESCKASPLGMAAIAAMCKTSAAWQPSPPGTRHTYFSGRW